MHVVELARRSFGTVRSTKTMSNAEIGSPMEIGTRQIIFGVGQVIGERTNKRTNERHGFLSITSSAYAWIVSYLGLRNVSLKPRQLWKESCTSEYSLRMRCLLVECAILETDTCLGHHDSGPAPNFNVCGNSNGSDTFTNYENFKVGFATDVHNSIWQRTQLSRMRSWGVL